MNALVIAPHVDLPWAEGEAQYVHNLLKGSIVTGKVTVRDILDVMGNDQYDILWFATHGYEDGLSLGDKQYLTHDVLAQLVRKCKCKLLFLNACSSERVAKDIFSAVQVRIACTIGDVNDTTAYFTGRVFAEYIASGLSVDESFANSKTAKFRMIPEPSRMGSSVESQVFANRQDIYEIRRMLGDMTDDMAELKKQDDLYELSREQDKIERERTRTILYFILLILVIVLGILIRNTVLLNQIVI